MTWILWVENNGAPRYLTGDLNSVTEKRIKLRTGVRQDDHFSLHLFKLAMDFLARWITKMNDLNILLLIFSRCRSCLLYVDDTLIFNAVFSPL
jgi:hypothetical protein